MEPGATVFRFHRLEIQPFQMGLNQIGKQQMGETRELPCFGFFLIENEVDDFAQVWVDLFVMELELLFELGERE